MSFVKTTTGVINSVEEYYQCACFSDEHLIKAVLDKEENQVHLMVCLRKHGFFSRVWVAIKYIFGYECKYGHFDDFIFQKEDVTCFRKMLEAAEKAEMPPQS